MAIAIPFAGVVPPDDPLLFHARSHTGDFSPFVEVEGGALEIRPDWVNDGDGLRGRRGRRAGRQFLYPGFRPTRIASHKPAGGIRVIALGGSTTFGLYVGAEAAFPASLEVRLSALAGGRGVEGLNLGCAGFASDRVLALLRSVLALEPDLVVVYTGHNEMLGGPASEGGELGPAQRLRARLLEASTLFAWLNRALATTLRAARTEQLREDVAALEAADAAPVDLRADFQGSLHAAQSERLFVDHLHPTTEGHALVAERLLGPVAISLGLDAGRAGLPGS
jgi:lysophospholipase L1-like esterase